MKLNKKFFSGVAVLLLAFATFSCAPDGHNQAEIVRDYNENDKRIYGNIDGEPFQLQNEYDAPDGIVDRMSDLRDKMYPKD
ncbi:MAG: hypothetical protein JJT94_15125 [Bernardetiaceae bacterium]|nr:hypothetical protein [Bernardetiaceae bacterium]